MISVVIPLYNKEHTIVNTLHSVLNQTFRDFEVIIIDDGSTDRSLAVIHQNFTDSRIRIINQENRGVSAARNKGISVSKGEYIAFLDADDEWMPYYLETVVNKVRENPNAGLIHVPAFHRDLLTGFGVIAVIKQFKKRCVLVDLFHSAYNICAQTSGIIVNREIFNTFRKKILDGFPEDMTYEEDMTCFFSFALFTPSLYIGYPLSIRNNNVKGQLVSQKKMDVLLQCQAKYLNRLFNSYLIIGGKNETFLKFFKYELRTRISSSLREIKYPEFVNMLSADVKRLILPIEWFFYKCNFPLSWKILLLKFFRLSYYFHKQKYSFI